MPSIFLTVLLAAAMAPIQTQPSTQTGPAATAAKSSAVASAKAAPSAAASDTNHAATLAPSDPVITIHGLCTSTESSKSTATAKCDTVVTKQKFDEVVNALNAIGPPLVPAQRHGVAEGYAATLLNYEAAKKAGVERDPRFADVMRLARMRAMGDMYNALIRQKAQAVSPQEIQDYYNANLPKFEELTLRRMTVPRYNTANLKDEEFAAKARKLAGEMHDRAAKGDDPDIIQKDAFSALGVKDPPTTHMAMVRRGIYAPDQEKQLFGLKPGEVTGIFEQPSALIVFRLEGRETPSLEKSKDEIVRTLIREHQEKMEQARDKSVQIEYNEQYLGPQQTSAWMLPGQSTAATGRNQPANNPNPSTKPAPQK